MGCVSGSETRRQGSEGFDVDKILAVRQILISIGFMLCIPGAVLTATLYVPDPDRSNPVGPILLGIGLTFMLSGIVCCFVAKKREKNHPVSNQVSAAPADPPSSGALSLHPGPAAGPGRPMPQPQPAQPPPYGMVTNPGGPYGQQPNYGPPPNQYGHPNASDPNYNTQYGGYFQYNQQAPMGAPPPYPGAPPPDQMYSQTPAYPPPPPHGQRY